MVNGRKTLFTVMDTPVKETPYTWVAPSVLLGLGTLNAAKRNPKRSLFGHLLVGLISTLIAELLDYGHSISHIVSARYADAPMDEIRVGILPINIYRNNDVPPQAHRMRAIGGPIFSGLLLVLSLVWRSLTRPHSVNRELADWACLTNALLSFGSLVPLPVLDGGSILKWTLVEKGHTPAEADWIVEQVNLALGATTVTVGAALATRKKWWAALTCVAAGAFAIGASLGKIK